MKLRLFLVGMLAAFLNFTPLAPTMAQIVGPPGSVSLDPQGKGAVNRRLSLAMGKSIAIDLPREAKDIMIANPAIANASVRSSTKIFIIGVALGQTNVHVLDADGRQIVGFDVEVGRDLVQVRSTIKQLLPDSNISVDAIGDSVIVSGSVANPLESQRVFEIATRLVGDPTKVVNGLSIRGRDQVHLKVTISEIQRTALKQLGVNLGLNSTTAAGGRTQFGQQNGWGQTGHTPNSGLAVNLIKNATSLTSTLSWLESQALSRTLAEPTLTAISGESAKFLAGGEYPIPVGQSNSTSGTPTTTIEFKTFGVSLVFTPVVMSEGRISLKVGTEVSELSAENAITINGTSIPGLKVRRADSTIELPSGGTIVMAGLLQESTKQAIERFPGLGNLPVIGTLFRSREFQRSQTELVVMVTPYIVNAVARNSLSKPDDGFQEPDDARGFLLGQFNKVYGAPQSKGAAAPSQRRYAGPIGHIKD